MSVSIRQFEQWLQSKEKKTLITKHIENHDKGTIQEFEQIFPNLTRDQIYNLLRDLKKAGRIIFKESKRWGYWSLK
ncbi:MAG: hypothetical protein A2315_14860 [Ignavibacteria bacterium RIFOXYB2_FULL_35_12]|nr:MAG: hypothetical protein A2058_04195 [Ignavibacteria bacterium GWA2_36_19]OGU58622.1 MAG: hypothetical protein A2X60_03825 [Ignavibacteria bacterium GWF2_35_20]OGU80417.1 MAG: hypothetical protein A2254_12240 [Ignavibacteria bacterium RIFOXYA2_FULL_35_9]OGU87099.1 MAG: hypothetical protein A3K31_13675 [Ignavibacteria bacterium RIFOXYA12_FULL_35_25]OGU92414.1 MAG: hypothetical protein A2492_04325 [Ignavibacteria bacterium RIFOXYC12_FULL_35_11]OGU95791.1 MAG: hypothetical protein A2347_04250